MPPPRTHTDTHIHPSTYRNCAPPPSQHPLHAAWTRVLSGAERASQSTLGNDRFFFFFTPAVDSLPSATLTYLLWFLKLLIQGSVISSLKDPDSLSLSLSFSLSISLFL